MVPLSPGRRRRSDRVMKSRYRTRVDHTRLCWSDTLFPLQDTTHTHTHTHIRIIAKSLKRIPSSSPHLTAGAALSISTLSSRLQYTGLILTTWVLLTLLHTWTHTQTQRHRFRHRGMSCSDTSTPQGTAASELSKELLKYWKFS